MPPATNSSRSGGMQSVGGMADTNFIIEFIDHSEKFPMKEDQLTMALAVLISSRLLRLSMNRLAHRILRFVLDKLCCSTV